MRVRDMKPDDVPAAAAVLDAGGWHARAPFFRKALALEACRPLVGTIDGEIVATGMATVNGRVGWIGTIFVHPALRRRGLGQAITEAVCGRLEAAGCETLALIASEYGRPVYEQMGFRIDAELDFYTAPRTDGPPSVPAGCELRRANTDDLPAILALDRRATDEDRSGLLAAAEIAILLDAGRLRGFAASIDPHWSAVIVLDDDAGLGLLEHVRRTAPGQARAVAACGMAASGLLAERGWNRELQSPRMLRGPAPDWRPELVWGIFGRAFG